MNFHNTRIWKFICLLFVYTKFIIFTETSPSRFIDCQSRTFLRKKEQTEPESPCLVRVDIKNHFSTDEIKYSYNSAQDSHTFTPISPCLIHTVTKGTRVLWDSEHKEYGTSVFVGTNYQGERIFRVYFSKYIPQPEFVTQSKKPDENVSTEDFDDYLIVLNVKNRQTTDRIEYGYDSTTGTHTFRALGPYLFGAVVKGDLLVWKAEQPFYPNTALVFKGPNDEPLIRLYFPFNLEPPLITHFIPETRAQKMDRKRKSHIYESIASKTPISLDVDYEWSTHLWHYAKENNTATYIPKEGYTFGQVEDVKGIGVSKKEAVIWKAREVLEYSTMVTYEHSKSIVTVYSANGTKRSFRKHERNRWSEEYSYQYEPGLVKETCALVDLDIKEKGLKDLYEFSSSVANDPLQTGKSTYKARTGFKFDIVRRGHEIIWRAKNQTEFSSKVCVNRYFNTSKTNMKSSFDSGGDEIEPIIAKPEENKSP
ncbi:hypothetical protein MACJ_003417 [Theileria orientalis]|uniref:Uncharacterized protein n=1 Tax=Theileria orientalis TaxID=68886 RepID=A0A976SK49_THEOR|nr:hypothetical protein MACJ_003417 [Theileria orientalis]